MKKKAVVLLSGGLDSTTVLAIALKQGYEPITLCFDYCQRHRVELEKSRIVSNKMGALEHKEVKIDLRQFGGSALTDDIEVPKGEVRGKSPGRYPSPTSRHETRFFCRWLSPPQKLPEREIFSSE